MHFARYLIVQDATHSQPACLTQVRLGLRPFGHDSSPLREETLTCVPCD